MIKVIPLIVLFVILNNTPAIAQTMTNSQYKLEEGGFNSISGEATSSQYSVIINNETTSPGEYSGTNYTVQSGFGSSSSSSTGSSSSTKPFYFSLSSLSVNFGKISPGEPIIRVSELSVDPGSSPGYQVTTSESNPLRNEAEIEIPDTSCDLGNCTEATSGIWASPLTYGLGYRCDNIDGNACVSDFGALTSFKAFPNAEIGEDPEVVMSGGASSSPLKSQITYKVNIPGNQAPGIYQNLIMYVALPTL